MLLKVHNEYLKGISKNNRPPVQEKPVKQDTTLKHELILKQEKKNDKPKENDEENDEEDEYEITKEVKPVYSTITNMEDIKRTFFNRDYPLFQEKVLQHPFKFYKASYRYSEDNTDRPSFIAKNLLRGFVQNLDDYRKYLLVGFRCVSNLDSNNTTHYKYPSYWIINSNDSIETILGSLYNDFSFTLLEETEEKTKMLKRMEKNEDENDLELIGEMYLH
jgi:hypothetical protein